MSEEKTIQIKFASENNLKGISVEIPHHQLTVVVGVSGSGKSSLAFDVIAREGQRRFFETFSTFSRQLMGKLKRPEVESIEGLSPVITLSQKTTGSNPRSTVGTLSDLYDHLRLLFARLGKSESQTELSRSLFSFNSSKGSCPNCTGLGLEEKISLAKLVVHPGKTLREGALAPTLPTGYIMYSQVTIDVLDQVCQAHDFSVDIPWQDLTPEQKEVILYGSTRIKVPFGKHSLESRLKWTGIAAKPREKDFYKGMIPIMENILKRDRNKNILRYAESLICSSCQGSRLNESARSVHLNGLSIHALSNLELTELKNWLLAQTWSESENAIAFPIISKMAQRIEMMERLGIGYLSLSRASGSLSGGESQRIRLINQVAAELSHVLYVFDEPSIGLHPRDNQQMIEILRQLVNQGNTVVVVEHDEETIRSADWIVDIGPEAGLRGGQLLYAGPIEDYLSETGPGINSPTWRSLKEDHSKQPVISGNDLSPQGAPKWIEFGDCTLHNLQHINARFQLQKFNIVTGVAGAGKASLLHGVVEEAVRNFLSQKSDTNSSHLQAASETFRSKGLSQIDKLITIDQKPIGRTPRSNPATYTGLADKIRDLFSKQKKAKQAGFSKSRFSFNTKGGRCETCKGAGRSQLGIHLLGNLEIECPTCQGKRFDPETLQIQYQGKNIFEVLELRVEEAIPFFKDQSAILRHLETLSSVGLGYLTLGQPSTTLSGGEAQRVKLASELHQPDTGKTLYLFDEPTIGLHAEDVQVLINAMRQLIAKGNTVICIEHDPHFIRQADWLLDLGPESGKQGGHLLYQGPPSGLPDVPNSLTGKHLGMATSQDEQPSKSPSTKQKKQAPPAQIQLRGVSTHLLKHIDVEFPRDQLTVITGLSGSGKSSLAFDTLFAEAQSRFSESLSTYARSLLRQSNPSRLESSSGLGPVVAIGRKFIGVSTRSTVGTLTGIHDHFRLLYSRFSQLDGKSYSANDFSFNQPSGACPVCHGLGFQLKCNPDLLLPFEQQSILNGAFSKNRVGKFYGDPFGKHLAILKEVAIHKEIDLLLPWKDQPENSRNTILYGTGEQEWQVTWEFKNKTRSGTQNLKAPWLGFCNYVDEEYQRKLHNKNIGALEELLSEVICGACQGAKLNPDLLAVQIGGKNISELSQLSLKQTRAFFKNLEKGESRAPQSGILALILPKIYTLLDVLDELGLFYLSTARSSRTLSGGEGQRIRLARAFSARLYGVTYVLDEPTIGLHEKDVISLIQVMRKLIALGNTVIVVEHDETVMREADHLIELGPGAGRTGGQLIAVGPPETFIQHPSSLTGKYLREKNTSTPSKASVLKASFGLRNAKLHNLKGLDLDLISGGIIAVTGVSGSGKSTLIRQVLLPSCLQMHPVHCDSTYGLDQFDQVQFVDQRPIAQHSSSSVTTWSGLMDHLRDLYASQPSAKEMGLKKSAFSYLHKQGACPDCNGSGHQRTALDFLGDVETICETCHGDRYRPEVLAVLHQGLSIGGVLKMTVAEASQRFSGMGAPKISQGFKGSPNLKALVEVGLGHLQLGQSLATLSGGEAQRLKLAKELVKHRQACNLYLLDEPTTGLHFQDVERLIQLFQGMVADGHTILVVEHHPMLIQVAHQVIELGPAGGDDGGEIVGNYFQ